MATGHLTAASATGLPPRRDQFVSVQYLRGIAALLVVFFHVRNPIEGMFNPIAAVAFGYRGVDIFFVISGFIMFTAARGEPVGTFIRRRISRIVPLYWVATLVLAAVITAAGRMDAAHVGATIRSLLFVPSFSVEVPGTIMPLLDPGWTLEYEMFFYAIFAIGLLTKRVVTTTCVILAGLVCLGWLIEPRSAIGLTYTSTLLLEFLGGLLLGAFFRRHPLRWLGWLLPPGFLALATIGEEHGGRLIAAGLPAMAIVAGAVSLDLAGRVPRWVTLKRIGDASYSIYLTHYFVLRALIVLWRHLPLTGWAQFLSYAGAAIAGSVAVGLAVHLYVEKPLAAVLRDRRARQERRLARA